MSITVGRAYRTVAHESAEGGGARRGGERARPRRSDAMGLLEAFLHSSLLRLEYPRKLPHHESRRVSVLTAYTSRN